MAFCRTDLHYVDVSKELSICSYGNPQGSRRISRVKAIAETSFIPAAYAIAGISVAKGILILLLCKDRNLL
jgi:hypothetical protein